MYYIYCYENKINQHKYVGQTNNFNRRLNEHKSCAFNQNSASYNDLIHQKIREYGLENFDIYILEKIYVENQNLVNEREQYWIKTLDTFRDSGKGYNSTLGGSNCNHKLKYLEHIEEIKNLIKKGTKYLDIQIQYDISAAEISNINHGLRYKDDNETYPLYQYYKEDNDYDELIDLLINSRMSFTEIATQLNMGVSTVKKINYGALRHGLYPSYPIRKISPYKQRAEKIKLLLKTSNKTYKEIAEEVSCDEETVRRINIGETFFDQNEQYPLNNL